MVGANASSCRIQRAGRCPQPETPERLSGVFSKAHTLGAPGFLRTADCLLPSPGRPVGARPVQARAEILAAAKDQPECLALNKRDQPCRAKHHGGIKDGLTAHGQPTELSVIHQDQQKEDPSAERRGSVGYPPTARTLPRCCWSRSHGRRRPPSLQHECPSARARSGMNLGSGTPRSWPQWMQPPLPVPRGERGAGTEVCSVLCDPQMGQEVEMEESHQGRCG